MLQRIKNFFNDIIAEFKKIAWATKKQTIDNSIAVLFIVFVMTIYFFLLDIGFGFIIQLIL